MSGPSYFNRALELICEQKSTSFGCSHVQEWSY